MKVVDRRSGRYSHPELGVIDIIQAPDGAFIYRGKEELGDVPDAWWNVLERLGPREKPTPKYDNPDMGTLHFLQGQGYHEVYICNRCGSTYFRNDLEDDQWPSEYCMWGVGGCLLRRILKPGERLDDATGPGFAPSPYSMGRDFRDRLNWGEAREQLAAWKQHVAARQARKTHRVHMPDERHAHKPCSPRTELGHYARSERLPVVQGDTVEIVDWQEETFGSPDGSLESRIAKVMGLTTNEATSNVFADLASYDDRESIGVPIRYLRLSDERPTFRRRALQP